MPASELFSHEWNFENISKTEFSSNCFLYGVGNQTDKTKQINQKQENKIKNVKDINKRKISGHALNMSDGRIERREILENV